MISSQHRYRSSSNRRWGAVSWWFSLLFVVPLLALIATIIWSQFLSGDSLKGYVYDAYTGDGLGDAIVQVGDRETTTENDGSFGIRNTDSGTITVSLEGYETANHTLRTNPQTIDSDPIEITLRPTTLRGTVSHRHNNEPIAGVRVEALVNGNPASTTETANDGTFLLTDIPDGAEIRFSYEDLAEVVEPVEGRHELDVSMRPGVITGTTTNQDGDALGGVTVAIGDVWTVSNDDGTYRLENAPEDGQLVFKSPGYEVVTRERGDEMSVDVTLHEQPIRSIYVTAGAAGNEQKFNELLDLVDRTELNSMVIDIKDSTGFVFYDTDVEMAHEIDAVRPQYDVVELLDELKSRGIYTIARQVIFEDPILAEARNDLAIMDSEGGLWRTWNGIVWLSAYEEDVWDYNIELMLEAVDLGFDEIQLDYMRFPSDGPLDRAEYGVDDHSTESRTNAITSFLEKAQNAIRPTPAYLAGDIFGLALWELGDGGIGQNLESMAPYLDYIAPMIYPSHFYPGSMGFDVPNDHPYEVILWSLQNGGDRIPNDVRKLRPWLQDFSYGQGRAYGPAEVRDQINASNDFGATGWMLWSAGNVYQEDALQPAGD